MDFSPTQRVRLHEGRAPLFPFFARRSAWFLRELWVTPHIWEWTDRARNSHICGVAARSELCFAALPRLRWWTATLVRGARWLAEVCNDRSRRCLACPPRSQEETGL